MTTRRVSVSVLVALVCMSGCTETEDTHHREVEPYRVSPLIQYNYRWSAESHIDLFSGPATAIRAYVESYYIASFTNSTAAGYPGFEKAIEQLVFDPPRERDINDATHHNPAPRIGTFYAHLMSIDESDNAIHAVLCEGKYSLMRQRPDGTYANYGGRTPHTARITLVPAPNGPDEHFKTVEGPARTPQSDMFGGWSVVRHSFSTDSERDLTACDSRLPDPPEDRHNGTIDVLTVPYPTLPPYPGWPEQPE